MSVNYFFDNDKQKNNPMIYGAFFVKHSHSGHQVYEIKG